MLENSTSCLSSDKKNNNNYHNKSESEILNELKNCKKNLQK